MLVRRHPCFAPTTDAQPRTFVRLNGTTSSRGGRLLRSGSFNPIHSSNSTRISPSFLRVSSCPHFLLLSLPFRPSLTPLHSFTTSPFLPSFLHAFPSFPSLVPSSCHSFLPFNHTTYPLLPFLLPLFSHSFNPPLSLAHLGIQNVHERA